MEAVVQIQNYNGSSWLQLQRLNNGIKVVLKNMETGALRVKSAKDLHNDVIGYCHCRDIGYHYILCLTDSELQVQSCIEYVGVDRRYRVVNQIYAIQNGVVVLLNKTVVSLASYVVGNFNCLTYDDKGKMYIQTRTGIYYFKLNRDRLCMR